MKNFKFLSLWLLLTTSMATLLFNSCDKGEDDPLTADTGVIINGVKWATRNVNNPGTFAATPEAAGMFYQWNRKVAWPATGETVSNWDSSTPAGTEWEKANDPSPAGWRVPTLAEIQTLFDENKVSHEWTTVNGVTGRRFTDKTSGNSIFLPAAGGRNYSDGTLYYAGSYGSYWSSTQGNSSGAYGLDFNSSNAKTDNNWGRANGLSCRCVAESD